MNLAIANTNTYVEEFVEEFVDFNTLSGNWCRKSIPFQKDVDDAMS